MKTVLDNPSTMCDTALTMIAWLKFQNGFVVLNPNPCVTVASLSLPSINEAISRAKVAKHEQVDNSVQDVYTRVDQELFQ